jgi:hypothetical protein
VPARPLHAVITKLHGMPQNVVAGIHFRFLVLSKKFTILNLMVEDCFLIG